VSLPIISVGFQITRKETRNRATTRWKNQSVIE
jgi:hypothetical protein